MKKTITILCATAIISILPLVALAQAPATPTPCSSGSATICNPLHASSVTAVLTNVVNIAIPIGAVIAVIMFIYVGFKFIFAQGKPEKISEAWKWFAWVAIGTAILLGAKVIVTVIEGTLTSAGAVNPSLFNQ